MIWEVFRFVFLIFSLEIYSLKNVLHNIYIIRLFAQQLDQNGGYFQGTHRWQWISFYKIDFSSKFYIFISRAFKISRATHLVFNINQTKLVLWRLGGHHQLGEHILRYMAAWDPVSWRTYPQMHVGLGPPLLENISLDTWRPVTPSLDNLTKDGHWLMTKLTRQNE